MNAGVEMISEQREKVELNWIALDPSLQRGPTAPAEVIIARRTHLDGPDPAPSRTSHGFSSSAAPERL